MDNSSARHEAPPDGSYVRKEYPTPPVGTLNKIRVIVRVRPFLEEEMKSEELSSGMCLRVKDNEVE